MKNKNGLDFEFEIHDKVLTVTKASGWNMDDFKYVMDFFDTLPGRSSIWMTMPTEKKQSDE